MAAVNTISYDTQNLEMRGVEYLNLAKRLEQLLSNFDRVMNEEVNMGLAGAARSDVMAQYTAAREVMSDYPVKITTVGNSIIEAARTGKAIDNSLVGDVSLNIM